ncbi:pyridoxamine 5'-phosphate oxidase family protein [Micromonospora sp. R77]|uniref:pyridoxamine 5'-phosphate oxidase family protein n=1 Tax=Micromonospora sp. R77 TaxID=2925836 RepID=UPI001F61C428|nr:pyridoxamine 5'-phosphate oxidase family protein [Micromonospora sp. R77]MCI4066142.1 pyridoxamine 5'-phosphate oxidase family protein [Micromonospora sp. R77]
MGTTLDITRAGVREADVQAAVTEVLGQARLITLATAGPHGPHASPVFFAADDALVLTFVSERSTRHTSGLADDARMSGAVFLEPPLYGEQLRGVQLQGTAGEVDGPDRERAIEVYQQRFPDFARDPAVRETFLAAAGPAVLYRFVVNELTVLDEPRFGRRVYIPAVVRR